MRYLTIAALLLAPTPGKSQNAYFFPQGSFDASVPEPRQFLGYNIGEWHSRHDRIISYMQELDRASDKAQFQIIGHTNEMRPQGVLTISSRDNLARLEAIREEHLKLCDPAQSASVTPTTPVIVLLGYNVHGNEPSSSEAAMLTAYYLVASQSEETAAFLKNAVILIDPNYNPDGRDRHSTWADANKAFPPVADPLDREHNEAWPGGRFNHYWFDLNRDWLPLAHVESRNRIEHFHRWIPNVMTDYHEMGTNATNFFEPTKPFGSENPVIPRSNYDQLNNLFAKYFSKALDEIGSLYFTREVFDNSYPGYGSTYPDIHGGLGLVFEQASSRGHAQQSSTKVVTFGFTIRNHVRTSLATVRASVENRELLLRHQQDYFHTALDEGRKSTIKGYVFGDTRDAGRTTILARLLNQHRIDTYFLDADLTVGSNSYKKGRAFVVPTDQKQYRLIRSIFEKNTVFYDSVFYDASTWNLPLAFGLPYDALTATVKVQRGQRVTPESLKVAQAAVAKSNYAYLVEWSDYNAVRVLYRLQAQGVFVKAAFKPFAATVNGAKQSFGYGTLVIPVADQNTSPDELHARIQSAAADAGVDVFAVSTGLSLEGIDLGSNNVRTVQTPKVAMLVGDGITPMEAGATWFLADSRIGLPVTKVNVGQFNRLSLSDYNTLILVSGNYSFLGESGVGKIKSWMQSGGTLILIRNAVTWAINNKLIDEQLKKQEDSKASQRIDYVTAGDHSGSRTIGGVALLADVDITHPLGFGYTRRALPVYRNHSNFLEASKSPFSTVAQTSASPLLSGYVNKANLEKIRNSPSAMVSVAGQGRAVLFIDDPNFRAYWFGTNRLLFNAIFFGNQIGSVSFEGEE
jgi:hypothetical protein